MLIFENYYALFLLLIIPLFLILYKSRIIREISIPLNISDWDGKSFSFPSKKIAFFRSVSLGLVILSFVFGVVALANPKITSTEKRYISRGTEIMFVIDTSPSMAALDFGSTNRLEIAKEAVNTVAEKIPEASMGIIAMASDADCVMPPSMDRKIFSEKLNELTLGTLGNHTALGVGISSAIYHLSSSKAPQKIIILITDGENNAGTIHPNTASKLASEQEIPVYVLGIGSRGTVPVEFTDPVTGDRRSGFMESSYDSEVLKTISDLTMASYYEIQSLPDFIDVLSSLIQNESVTARFYSVSVGKEYYFAFLYLAAVSIMLSWIIDRLLLKEVL